MKTTSFLIGCILAVCFLVGNVTAQSPASESNLQGTLHSTDTILFLGKTSVTATFSGFPMDTVVNTSLAQGMNAFTLLGGNTISGLSTVIVAENIDITQVGSLQDLYLHYADHLHQFTNAQIVTDTGFFLLGYPTGGTINVRSTAAYAATSSRAFILNQSAIPFFLMATQTPVTLTFSGDFAVLAQMNTAATVRVQDQHGKNLWSGHSTKDYLIIQDKHFQISQQPPLSLFPLNPKDSTIPPLSYSVTPSDPSSIHIRKLLDSVYAEATRVTNTDVSQGLKTIEGFDTILSSASVIANGAMILTHTTDTITIDHSAQTFRGSGIVRFHDLTVTYAQPDSGPAIQGTYSLVFLGDHFYNPQAKNTDNGIAFPYLLLVIWVIGLAVFLYVRFFLRPAVEQQRDARIKKYALWVHLVLLILGFVLLDWEVSNQFGTSGFLSLASQGVSMITGLFFGLELFVWVLGYVLLAIPVRLLINAGLRVFHIGKGGRGIGAGIGDFSIWVFSAFYLLLFVNIVMAAFNLSSLFTAG
jgi:hypothetical protein